MVPCSDGGESSEDLSVASEEAMNTTYDSDYHGLADGVEPYCCKHDLVVVNHVAFEGVDTGRRYLGCPLQEGDRCNYDLWVDKEWPGRLQKTLGKLWEMYEESNQAKASMALAHMEERLRLRHDNGNLEHDLRKSWEELARCIEEKHLIGGLKDQAEEDLFNVNVQLEERKITVETASNLHKVYRLVAEKERDKVLEVNKKLELKTDDLLKETEAHRAKVRKIRGLCDKP